MQDTQFKPVNLGYHFLLTIGGSLLILAALFFFVSQAGENVRIDYLIDVILSSDKKYIAIYAVFILLGVMLRAYRYLLLLYAADERNLPTFKNMALITAIRGMTVDFLPARLGEFVYIALLKRAANTAVSSGASSLFFAILLDIVVLAPITIIVGLSSGFPNKTPYLVALIAVFLAVGIIIFLRYILPWLLPRIEQLPIFTNKIMKAIFGFMASLNKAMQSTLRAGVFLKTLGLTFLIRSLKYGGLLMLFKGVTDANFASLAALPSLAVLGSMIASEMTAALPIPTLMSFGSWEIGGTTLLAIAGAVPQEALITMFSIHVQSQAVDYAIGITAFILLFEILRRRKTIDSTSTSTTTTNQRWIWSLSFALVALILSYFTWFSLGQDSKARELANQQGEISAIAKQTTRPAWFSSAKGFVVWSSNRSGNHDILLMTLPEQKIRALTSNPHTETYPRISPNGKSVVFARAHKEWQSQRDTKPWDIWMVDIASGEETKIAKWGTAPSWSPDGSFITFQRDPGQLMAYDIKSKSERVYYASGHDAFMKSPVNLDTPSVGFGEKIAFTFRNHGQPTNVIRTADNQFEIVHRDACQVMWTPSGKAVSYVQKGGRQTNQIMLFNPVTKDKQTLLDLPGEFSHEYFPRFSKNEKYLIFAASSEGHEHDIADYEIFLWQLGRDASEAQRLTFDKANDSWPDIYIKE